MTATERRFLYCAVEAIANGPARRLTQIEERLGTVGAYGERERGGRTFMRGRHAQWMLFA